MLLKIGNATVEGEVFLTEEGKSCKDYEATYTYSENRLPQGLLIQVKPK